jgi:4-diphosphocytidyl-2-C-methyl-D-erythritol kinase
MADNDVSGVRHATAFAPAKLNFGLRIVGRRPDGFHLLDSVVGAVGIYDVLRISIGIPSGSEPRIDLRCLPDGSAPADSRNLVWRAATLYCAKTSLCADLSITLEKHIPVGGGFGGGSSDAAATLSTLRMIAPNRQADIPTMQDWALELGADVPFFLYGTPARMRGIGEVLEPLRSADVRRIARAIVIAFPGVGLSTAQVYGRFDDSLTTKHGVSMVRASTDGNGSMQAMLRNDLELAATQVLPELKELKRDLRALGARVAVMTGSGSGMFGIWDQAYDACAAAAILRSHGIWARATGLLEQRPAIEMDDAK